MSGRLLIIDCNAASRMLLRGRLMEAYYEVETLGDPGDPALPLRAAKADLVVLVAHRPGRGIQDALRRLKSRARCATVPVILAVAAEGPRGEAGFDLGADDVVRLPVSDAVLQVRIRSLIRIKRSFDELHLRDLTVRDLGLDQTGLQEGAARPPLNVLVARGADPAGAADLTARLGACTRLTARLLEREEDLPLRIGGAHRLPALVLRLTEPEAIRTGFRRIAQLRADPATRAMTILALTDPADDATALQALDLGASDFCPVDAPADELTARLVGQDRRRRMMDRLREALAASLRDAVTDPLTGLHNRRFADAHMPRLMARSATDSRPFAVMMLDLDAFKSVNDRFGHAAGDLVLRETALRLSGAVRAVDLVARWGGEEFLVALPGAAEEEATGIAERVRLAVAGTPFALGTAGAPLPITISIGLSVARPGCGADLVGLLAEADAALYAAKRSGRNRVEVAAAA
ncbi:MAG: diguanylate cyclase [Pseudomonadota bacterium]